MTRYKNIRKYELPYLGTFKFFILLFQGLELTRAALGYSELPTRSVGGRFAPGGGGGVPPL